MPSASKLAPGHLLGQSQLISPACATISPPVMHRATGQATQGPPCSNQAIAQHIHRIRHTNMLALQIIKNNTAIPVLLLHHQLKVTATPGPVSRWGNSQQPQRRKGILCGVYNLALSRASADYDSQSTSLLCHTAHTLR